MDSAIDLKVVDEYNNGDTNPILIDMDHEELESLEYSHYDSDPYDPEAGLAGKYEFTKQEYDEYITMEVILPMDDPHGKTKVVIGKRYAD